MNKSESKFNKVMGPWDILVIAFGAMIGWGWGVSTGLIQGTGLQMPALLAQLLHFLLVVLWLYL